MNSRVVRVAILLICTALGSYAFAQGANRLGRYWRHVHAVDHYGEQFLGLGSSSSTPLTSGQVTCLVVALAAALLVARIVWRRASPLNRWEARLVCTLSVLASAGGMFFLVIAVGTQVFGPRFGWNCMIGTDDKTTAWLFTYHDAGAAMLAGQALSILATLQWLILGTSRRGSSGIAVAIACATALASFTFAFSAPSTFYIA